MRAGSPPRSRTASRIAARSTTTGTPVKSWSRTRDGRKVISLLGSSVADPARDGLDRVARHRLAVLVAQQVLEQDPERVGEAGDVVGVLECPQAHDLVLAAADAERRPRAEAVRAGHAVHPRGRPRAAPAFGGARRARAQSGTGPTVP